MGFPHSAVIFYISPNQSVINLLLTVCPLPTVVNSTKKIVTDLKKRKNGASTFVKAPFFMHDYFYQIYLP